MASWKTKIGLVLSGIGVLVSFSSFVFFFYGNYHAAVWAFISGILAAIDFHILFLDWRKTLSSWHTTSSLKDIRVLAVVGLICGLAATIWYIFFFIYFNLPIMPISNSYHIACVWSLMTAKWGLGLYLSSRHLCSELQNNYPELQQRYQERQPISNFYHRPSYSSIVTG